MGNCFPAISIASKGVDHACSRALHSTTSQQGVDITLDDRYELSDGGKTLTVTRKITTPDQPFTLSLVFTKKPGA